MTPKRCKYNPKKSGNPGMFHCPECGDMVIGGMAHPDYRLIKRKNKPGQGRKRLSVDKKRVQLGMKVLPSTKALFERHGRKARAIAEAAIIAALTG